MASSQMDWQVSPHAPSDMDWPIKYQITILYGLASGSWPHLRWTGQVHLKITILYGLASGSWPHLRWTDRSQLIHHSKWTGQPYSYYHSICFERQTKMLNATF